MSVLLSLGALVVAYPEHVAMGLVAALPWLCWAWAWMDMREEASRHG